MSVYDKLISDLHCFFSTGQLNYLSDYQNGPELDKLFEQPLNDWAVVLEIQGMVMSLYLLIQQNVDTPKHGDDQVRLLQNYMYLQNLYFRLRRRFGESAGCMRVYMFKPIQSY
jgi:hypothetical protein